MTRQRIAFLYRIGDLLVYAREREIQIVCTCFFRTQEEQDRLRDEGKSHILRSKHQEWLAMDFAVIKNGEVIWDDCEEYQRLGAFWKALGGVWGGDWPSLNDIYHFQVGEDWL